MTDLSNFDVAFCDSPAALVSARGLGLRDDTRILTTAPAVMRLGRNAVDIEARVPSEVTARFIAGVGDYVKRLHAELRDYPNIGEDACSAALGAFNEHKYLHKALALTLQDWQEPRVILQPKTGDKRLDFVLQSLWPTLLETNTAAVTVDLVVPKPTRGASLGGGAPSWAKRLQNLHFDRLAYHALLRLGGVVGALSKRPAVLVLRDSNELVKETAVSFAFRGHPLVLMEEEPYPDVSLPTDVEAIVEKTCSRLFDEVFAGQFMEPLQDALRRRLSSAAIRELKVVAAGYPAWRKRLSKVAHSGAVILHGGPIGGRGGALHKAAREEAIRLYGFQHGVRREIANWPLDVRILNENNFSDMLLCYNSEGASYSAKDSPFAISAARSVGMPSDYRRKRNIFARPAKQPLLYISTLLYRGSRQLSNTCLSDPQRSEKEEGLVKDVLAKLPYKVRYKPYPSLRYEGDDPVHLAVMSADNVHMFEDEIDLRYMLQQHQVAITSGATSTVGWCALSDLPLVFIDDAEAQPLNAAAREKFETAFFVFDTKNPNYKRDLVAFLSQPIKDIQAQSAEKADARRVVRRDLFGLADGNSGLNAYRIICEDMKAVKGKL